MQKVKYVSFLARLPAQQTLKHIPAQSLTGAKIKVFRLPEVELIKRYNLLEGGHVDETVARKSNGRWEHKDEL